MNVFTPEHILCPVDFSDQSGAALRAAGVIARVFGSEVVVLHVQRLEAPVYFTPAQTQALRTQLYGSARAARSEVPLLARFVGTRRLVALARHGRSALRPSRQPTAAPMQVAGSTSGAQSRMAAKPALFRLRRSRVRNAPKRGRL